MKSWIASLFFIVPALSLAAAPNASITQAAAGKFIDYHITLQNESTGAVIGDWSLRTQDGVPTPLQSMREITYRKRVETTSSDVSTTIEPAVVKTGATLIVTPHITRNGDVATFLNIGYTTLNAMRTASFEGQTIDLPYTSTVNAGDAVLTTPAKPEAVFELNPQDKFVNPGSHGYGVPLMFKVSARVD